jgi:hypothetical protein
VKRPGKRAQHFKGLCQACRRKPIPCSVTGCVRRSHAKGLCSTHHSAHRRAER